MSNYNRITFKERVRIEAGITIDGEEHFRKHDYFKPDAAVVITYH